MKNKKLTFIVLTIITLVGLSACHSEKTYDPETGCVTEVYIADEKIEARGEVKFHFNDGDVISVIYTDSSGNKHVVRTMETVETIKYCD